jgi:hypothetical protein
MDGTGVEWVKLRFSLTSQIAYFIALPLKLPLPVFWWIFFWNGEY